MRMKHNEKIASWSINVNTELLHWQYNMLWKMSIAKQNHKSSTAISEAYSQCLYHMNHNILLGTATVNP